MAVTTGRVLLAFSKTEDGAKRRAVHRIVSPKMSSAEVEKPEARLIFVVCNSR